MRLYFNHLHECKTLIFSSASESLPAKLTSALISSRLKGKKTLLVRSLYYGQTVAASISLQTERNVSHPSITIKVKADPHRIIGVSEAFLNEDDKLNGAFEIYNTGSFLINYKII